MIANATDLRAALEGFDSSADKMKYGFADTIFAPTAYTKVCFGFDTRETSPMLVEAAMTGAKLMGANVVNYGLCTTPMLHWLVSEKHTKEDEVSLYYENFKGKFLTFLELVKS